MRGRPQRPKAIEIRPNTASCPALLEESGSAGGDLYCDGRSALQPAVITEVTHGMPGHYSSRPMPSS
jgi:hypothetical protein